MHAIKPYMQEDKYTLIAGKPEGYLVRSLYFDSFDYLAYREKDQGDYGRVKLRIRSYTDQPNDQTRLSAEFKTKFGNVMKKFGAFVSMDEYKEFINTFHWPEARNPVMEDFERLTILKGMRPKTVVQYHRQGYKSREGHDLRITLDHNVKSAPADTLFQKDLFFKQHVYDTVVLEIKADMEKPKWLCDIVKRHGLKAESNSKYAQSIETSRPDIRAEGWRVGKEDLQTGLPMRFGIDPGAY